MEKLTYIGTGRRKSAVARVFLRNGSGKITINNRSLQEYFPTETLRTITTASLELLSLLNHFDCIVNVRGGGVSGQAEAIRHGITKALLTASESYRPALKNAGFITRDPRVKERKKYGLKKARKAPQWSKR